MTKRMAWAAASIAVVGALAPVIAAAPAQAAAYRYWSYWLGADGQWSFSSVGASSRMPADGTVEGWRFSVSGVAGNDQPAFAAEFDVVCADTPAQEGRKRIAVVVDPGLPEDAPDGEAPPGAWALCVVAEPQATGYDVLRAAAPVRVDSGLICAIGGYPARECAVVIDVPEPTPSPEPSKTPHPTKTPKPSATATPSTSSPKSTSAAPTAPTPTASGGSPLASSVADTASVTPSTRERTSASMTPTPTPTPSSASPTPTPTPSLSVLAAPVTSGGSDGGNALVVGAAVLGIGALGGSAFVLMRRRPL